MGNAITTILIIVGIAFYWYSADMNEYSSMLLEEVEKRNELLSHVYTDLNTLQEQMTFNKEYYERQIEIAQDTIEQAMFAFYYVPTAQRYGVDDLQDYLQRWQWKEDAYVQGKFDCSQMSAYLERNLENEGYHTFIVGGDSPDGSGKHAWLLVETSEGRYTPVEATHRITVDLHSPYFDNYYKYEFYFETIQEALAYHPREYKWWR